jgi:hypothetical protein
MVGSYSTRLCAVFALRGQCLNGHCSVMRDLRRGRQTLEGIVHAQEAQAESLQRFVEGSRALFVVLFLGDQSQCCGDVAFPDPDAAA